MYGTVARLRVKSGMAEQFNTLGDEQMAASAPGMLGSLVYQSSADEQEFWLVVAFESRAAYEANAGAPEQHERFTRMRELLAADPEWHDGSVIASYGAFKQ